jgi:putative ABC transport system permease protein
VKREGKPGSEARKVDAIDEEVRFHLEGRIEELMAAGLTEEEARRRAHEAFGDVDRVRSELVAIDTETARRTRRRELLNGFLRDVRIGWRRLRRSPGYTLVAVLTMMLGIGAAVAMFTVVNAVVLRPLPYPGADRLVRIWPAENFNIALSREMAPGLPSVSTATGISRWGLTMTGEGQASVLNAAAVDASYFDVFGVRPELGRAFTEGDTEPAASDVVLLGHGLWQSRFGGDRGIIGQRISLAGYGFSTREVIGVMPEGHNLQGQPADVWIPFSLSAGTPFLSDSSWYVNEVVGRLAAGATVGRASQEVRSLAVRLNMENPSRFDDEIVAAASAMSFLDSVVGDVRRLLWTLLAAVGLVLLIACGNLANLLVARTTARRRELAVQAAMGASRGRLVRQQLAESTIIAVSGGTLGVLLARLLLLLVGVADVSGLPRTGNLALDGKVLAFGLVVSFASLLLFGLLPAVRAASQQLRPDLTSGSRGTGVGHGVHRFNRMLVAAQIAMATVLTIGAGLMIGSFLRLKSVDAGMDTSDVLAIQVQPPADRYTGVAYVQYYETLTERLRQLPGVTGVGAIHLLPFTNGNWSFPYLAEGHAADPNTPLPSANFRMIMPGYFDAVDQPVVAGRAIGASDGASAPAVVVINATLARTLWPGEDPVGKELRIFGSMPHRVIGVVGDVHQVSLDRAPLPEMYVPVA